MTQDQQLIEELFRKIGKVSNYDPERDMPENLVVNSEDAYWIGEDVTHNPGRIGCLLKLPSKAIDVFLQDIPVGATSDLQRHTHETIHYVIEGEGYSEIGPKVVQWKTGSFIYTPVWVWHRHYNDSHGMTRMLTIELSRLLDAMALGRRESAGLVSYSDYMARPEAKRV